MRTQNRLIDPSMQIRRHTGLNRLVKDLFQGVKKPPQKTYRQNLRDTLRLALVNLYNASYDDGWIDYHRDRRGLEYQRYRFFTARYLNQVVEYLYQNSLIYRTKGYFSHTDPSECYPSRMKASPSLLDLFNNHGIVNATPETKPPADLLLLKDASGAVKPFEDSAWACRTHKNIASLNDLYGGHLISLNDREVVRRFVYRVFNGDQYHGGRFYGAHWQFCKKHLRSTIKIDCQSTVELDYKSLHPSMLYAQVGEKFSGDKYQIPGYPSDPASRKFIKIVTLIRINSGDRRKTIYAVQGMLNRYKLKRPSWLSSLPILIANIESHHAPISHLFKPDTGTRLQRLDSDLSEQIYTAFSDADIPVLGVHDSFIVPARYRQRLYDTMESAFFYKFGELCEIDG